MKYQQIENSFKQNWNEMNKNKTKYEGILLFTFSSVLRSVIFYYFFLK